jgi:hypothetical protein
MSNMSTGPRKADGHAEDKDFAWLEGYKAALLEFDPRRVPSTIEEALKAIEMRKQALQSEPNTFQERSLLEHAQVTLWAIKAPRFHSAKCNASEGNEPRIKDSR